MAKNSPTSSTNRSSSGLRPYYEDSLLSEFDQFFNSFLEASSNEKASVETWEDDNTLFVDMDLPGLKASEIKLDVDENTLTVEAKRSSRNKERESFQSYRRSMSLPHGVDADKISAQYEDGVLSLKIPKAEKSQGRRIQVQGPSSQKEQTQVGETPRENGSRPMEQ